MVIALNRILTRMANEPSKAALILAVATVVKAGVGPVPDLAFEAAVSEDPRVFNPEWSTYTWLWNSPFNKIIAFSVGFGGDEFLFFVLSAVLLFLALGLVLYWSLCTSEDRERRLAGLAGVLLGPLLASQVIWLGRSDVPAIVAGFSLAIGISPLGLVFVSLLAGFNHFEVSLLQLIVFAVLPTREGPAGRKLVDCAIFGGGALLGRVGLYFWNREFGIDPSSRLDWVVNNLDFHARNLLSNPFVWLFSLLGVAWVPTVLLASAIGRRAAFRLCIAALVVIIGCSVVADSSRIGSLVSIPLLYFVGSNTLTSEGLSVVRRRDVMALGVLVPPLIWWGGSAAHTGWPYLGELLGL